MAKLNVLEPIVKEILTKYPEARNSDMNLYFIYCTRYGVCTPNNFFKLFENDNYRRDLGLYTFGSVERCARKLRAENNDLKATNDDEKYEHWKEVRDYASE